MRLFLVLNILLISLVSLGTSESKQGRLAVHLYIESLCPDSIRFIQNQLYPAYDDLKDQIDVTFVPFGKADSHNDANNQVSFTCHHGAAECYGNLLQSCALHIMNGNSDAQMDFMACQMAFEADATGETCVKKVNYPFKNVESCIKNSVGTYLQLAAEQMTKTVYPLGGPLTWVPTLVYNWTWNSDLHERSQLDFATVVGEQVDGAAPSLKQNLLLVLCGILLSMLAISK